MTTFAPVPTATNATIPDYSSVPFVAGFRLNITGNTTFTLSAGCARAFNSGFVIEYPAYLPAAPAFLTCDISTVGLGGCYPNSIASLGLAANQTFGVYVIAQSSGTTGGSLNPVVLPQVVVATGNNFLPAGYDAFKRVGYVSVNHSTSYLISMQQSGNGNERTYVFADPIVALSAGASTTPAIIDLTASSGLIPGFKHIDVLLNVEITPAAADGYVCIEPGSLTAASVSPVQIFGSVAAHKNSSYVQMTATPNATTGNANLQYFVDNGSSASTINVVGFVDSFGFEVF
jgi:hypothetical protein